MREREREREKRELMFFVFVSYCPCILPTWHCFLILRLHLSGKWASLNLSALRQAAIGVVTFSEIVKQSSSTVEHCFKNVNRVFNASSRKIQQSIFFLPLLI